MHTEDLIIRPFEDGDSDSLLLILKGLIPEYFAESEYEDFRNYLSYKREDYFVVCEAESVIAAGGINYFPDKRIARLSWDLVDKKCHGKGIGRLLTQFRMQKLIESKAFNCIEVRTSQFANGFYASQGFIEKFRTSNYWGEGIHLVHMEILL